MEAKFTPGPWFADAEGCVWRRDPSDLYQNGGGVAGDKPLAIAQKGWYGADEQGFPVEANARLIAAAPELLSSLQFAVKLLAGLPHVGGTAQLEHMRGVIAKATTGERP